MRKAILSFFVIQFLCAVVLGQKCEEVGSFSIVDVGSSVDVIVKATILEQAECNEEGYNEIVVLQECLFGNGGSVISTSTQQMPKLLIRGLHLCNLRDETNASYIFFLNQKPSQLLTQDLECVEEDVESLPVLYTSDDGPFVKFSEEARRAVMSVTNSMSCATIRSKSAPPPEAFQGFCKCGGERQQEADTGESSDTSNDQEAEEEDGIGSSPVVVVDRVVVEVVGGDPIVEEQSNSEQVVVIDRVSDIVSESQRILEDSDLESGSGIDENGDVIKSVAALASAILASVSLLFFL
eukprot:TRINITY_DN465_c0_g2_i4.p2 TRINITY_DN465_c0_g2~~TRINITY_DN465_c0_g2_i4.p2  ORF type:complete len:295 (-),score=62.39 TRINITY_DN465_c0_g2_i4:397-1281(-)